MISMIANQIARQKRPTDKGLLERVEADKIPHLYDLLALISRVADVLEKDFYLTKFMEDEAYVAFDALDKLRGKFIDRLHEDETGITAEKQRENAIRDHHDYNRNSKEA